MSIDDRLKEILYRVIPQEGVWYGLGVEDKRRITSEMVSEIKKAVASEGLGVEGLKHTIGYLLEERDFKRTLYEEMIEDVVQGKKIEYLQNPRFRADCDAEVALKMYAYRYVLSRLSKDLAIRIHEAQTKHKS